MKHAVVARSISWSFVRSSSIDLASDHLGLARARSAGHSKHNLEVFVGARCAPLTEEAGLVAMALLNATTLALMDHSRGHFARVECLTRNQPDGTTGPDESILSSAVGVLAAAVGFWRLSWWTG